MPTLKYKHRRLIRYFQGKWRYYRSFLDAGGGDGKIIETVFSPFKVNVDIDRTIMRKIRGVHNVLADICALPFRDDSFHASLCSEVLEHVNDSEQAVKEVCRVAWEVHITTPNNSRLRRFLWWLRGKPALSASGHVREYCLQDIQRMLNGTEHRITQVKGIGFIMGRTKWLNWLENRWLSSKLWVITCRC